MVMGPDRWKRIEQLYHDALDREERDRSTFVRESCGTDTALLQEVESLLAHARGTDGFMEDPAIDVASRAFAPDQPGRTWTLAAGTRLGPYTVVAALGAGGMGEVYRARDERLGRDVAIKVLTSNVTRDDAAVEHFSREARAASALNHPNIVTIYEIAAAPHVGRFIAMELIHGSTLRSLIPRPFALDAFARIGSQLAKALAVAHVAGIVHRDVKPENVMVREDGYVKLLDFGLARLVAQDAHDDAAIETRRVPLGTLGYASPEQICGERVTAATDIFSLGVLLYELATGQRPFAAVSKTALMQAVVVNHAQPPSHLIPAIPRTVDALVLQMLEKDARNRPGASEVDTALAELIGHRGTAARRAAPVEAARHSVGRAGEQRELRDAFDASIASHGLLVAVAGEAGIGKTTLVDDFLSELAVADGACRVGRSRCSERLAGTGAYLPWLEMLDGLIRDSGGDSVVRLMRSLAPSWFRRVTVRASPESAEATSPEDMKRELVAFLTELARLAPLVLFFDDVHWADVSTIDLLSYLAARFDALRVLVVATYRPSEMLLARHPFVSVKLELVRRRVCHEMPLGFLTSQDIDTYLTLEFPTHAFPADLAAVIHAKTEGHPLFMADIVRHLRDSHAIGEEHGRWLFTGSLADLQRELPQSVRSMIDRKRSQLSRSDARLLAAASVQGCEFDSAVVAEALGRDAADVEERLDVLDRLHFFVRLIRDGELPDRTPTLRYRFVHVLYQNALYDSLRPSRKAAVSAAIAHVLTCAMANNGSRSPPSSRCCSTRLGTSSRRRSTSSWRPNRRSRCTRCEKRSCWHVAASTPPRSFQRRHIAHSGSCVSRPSSAGR